MRLIDITPQHDRVEDIVWRVGHESSTEWLLRIDDDEFPSASMLDWIRRQLVMLENDAVGFSRRWCWYHAGRLAYATPRDFFWRPELPDQLDSQLRLFRPNHVEWTTNIHTDGFTAKNTLFAPPSAYFCHFDWMIRSHAQRKEKMARYDAQQPGAGTGTARFYLPEDRAADDLRLRPLETREFNRLARAVCRDSSWHQIIRMGRSLLL
jgi:hypothetical protein